MIWRVKKNGDRRRTSITSAAAWIIALFGCCILWPSPSNSVDFRQPAAERIAAGFAELLEDQHDTAGPALEALANKRRDTFDPNDHFWPDFTRTIMADGGVHAALGTYAARRYPIDGARLDRLTQQLPELADAIAEQMTLSPSALGNRSISNDVLRRMQEPVVAAQRALLHAALDAANPRRSELVDRIVSAPTVTAQIKADVLALLSSPSDEARDLAFRYAIAVKAPVDPALIERALHRDGEVALLRAALTSLRGWATTDASQHVQGVSQLAQRTKRPDIWAEAITLLASLSPADASRGLGTRASDPQFLDSDYASALFTEAATNDALLRLLVDSRSNLPSKTVIDNSGCRVLPGILKIVAARSPKDVLQTLPGILARVTAHDGGRGCNIAAMAGALDEAVQAGQKVGATNKDLLDEIDKETVPAERSIPIDSAETEALSTIFQAANLTRNFLASDVSDLKAFSLRPDGIAPGIAALVLALPADHALLHGLRTEIKANAGVSLSESVHHDDDRIARILRLTDRSSGWSNEELRTVADIIEDDANTKAARAGMDILVDAARPDLLLEVVDRIITSQRGDDQSPSIGVLWSTRAIQRAAQIAPDPTSVLTTKRVAWLLEKLANNSLRGRSVRALALHTLTADDYAPIAAALARAVAGSATHTEACLDLAALGPMSSPRPALTVLGLAIAEQYGSESWGGCLTWLAPSSGSRLTDAGQLLVAMADERSVVALADKIKPWSQPLADLWIAADREALKKQIRGEIAKTSVTLAGKADISPGTISDLYAWDKRLRDDFPDQASAMRWAWLSRAGILLAYTIPGALLLHLLFWAVLFALYPGSVRLQTHVFYNPLVRTILGFGYIDLLLVWIAPLRRLLFSPFRDALLGEAERVEGGVGGSYYPRSGVTRLPHVELQREIADAERQALGSSGDVESQEILKAFSSWSGATFLFGPSGRGKTSYLRHALGTRKTLRFPFIYLKATECRAGVVDAICAKLGGLGQDKGLITSLVRTGLFDVYLDGLNEVEQATQEIVIQFIVENRAANVFVATQEIDRSLPSKVSIFYLLPLTRPQMKEFLESREPTLEDTSLIRGDLFNEKATAFIDELMLTEATPSTDTHDTKRRELVAKFLVTLANPIDLESAAQLLALDIEPDPLRLPQQQFRLVEEDYLSRTQRPFPTETFARSVLDARRADKTACDVAAFGPVISVLEKRKQVRSVSVSLPNEGSITEYQFRHERIADFYTHFALLGDDPKERFELATERPFEGVFEYLARELPPDAAAQLNEFLQSDALDRNDHRLSDRFLEHLRWRSLLDRSDPSWLIDFDLPPTQEALNQFESLRTQRQEIENNMRTKRDLIDEARQITRALSASSSTALESAAIALFEHMSATLKPTEGGSAPLLEVPEGPSFALICLAGDKIAGRLAQIGTNARLNSLSGRKVLLLNPHPSIAPQERDWECLKVWSQFSRPDLFVIGTMQLQELFLQMEHAEDKGQFWTKLFGLSGDPPKESTP